MESVKDLIDGVVKLASIVSASSVGTTLTVAGLLLILVTCLLVSRSKSVNTSFSQKAFITCFSAALFFCLAGPCVSLAERLKSDKIQKVSTLEALENLKNNWRVSWLIRLIPYDPKKEPGLAVSKLRQLGSENQRYTFVGSYAELKGQKVGEAVRMLGGSVSHGQHISAIIFRSHPPLVPANAKGLLQVVKDLQSDDSLVLPKKFELGKMQASLDSIKEHEQPLVYWAWSTLAPHFREFCEKAKEFVAEEYSVKAYLGKINMDWNPLGFAMKNAASDDGVCDMNNWDAIKGRFATAFGARIFFAPNIAIEEAENSYLIDFGDPENQLVPDIGESS